MSVEVHIINVLGALALLLIILGLAYLVASFVAERVEKGWRLWLVARHRVGAVAACRYRIGAWLLAPYLERRYDAARERLKNMDPTDNYHRGWTEGNQIAYLDMFRLDFLERADSEPLLPSRLPMGPLPPIDEEV